MRQMQLQYEAQQDKFNMLWKENHIFFVAIKVNSQYMIKF
jgi:hypothetical protein